MRTTKTLVCLAALAAGVLSSMAQSNVYSLNIVGYVNVPLQNGKYDIVANPLNTTNNNVTNIFAGLPAGSSVSEKNVGSGFTTAFNDPDFGWNQDGNPVTLQANPGKAFYVLAAANYTNTFVGEVILNSVNPIPVNYSIRASILPQQGLLQTELLYPANPGDTISFKIVGGLFDSYVNDPDFGWTPSEPIAKVAQGFWILRSGAGANWVRNFTP
jgi:hypothetical protein